MDLDERKSDMFRGLIFMSVLDFGEDENKKKIQIQ